ncbi:MAG: hypothetical protein HQM01_04145 [Magnetococcales bacterium]|nr:hypothetical protein [Magnetococcales bacterium]
MVDARVVDTNVLIVASAADDGSPFRPEATPVEEAHLRQRVLEWLIGFENDKQNHIVLDGGLILDEYGNKLTEQDYGLLVVLKKINQGHVIWVQIHKDLDGHAVLPVALDCAMTDRADRKMVAGVLAAQRDSNVLRCMLTNACDTDWLECAEALKGHGVEVEHLLEEWLQAKWKTTKQRRA